MIGVVSSSDRIDVYWLHTDERVQQVHRHRQAWHRIERAVGDALTAPAGLGQGPQAQGPVVDAHETLDHVNHLDPSVLLGGPDGAPRLLHFASRHVCGSNGDD